jgi:hypothetical protein
MVKGRDIKGFNISTFKKGYNCHIAASKSIINSFTLRSPKGVRKSRIEAKTAT